MNDFPECKEAFELYSNAHAEMSDILAYHKFLLGFKTGAQIMIETLEPIN